MMNPLPEKGEGSVCVTGTEADLNEDGETDASSIINGQFSPPVPQRNDPYELMEDSCLSAIEFSQCQHELLERLSKDPSIIVKSQQRNEPDLTSEQKLDYLKKIFAIDPNRFLIRFGKHLKAADSPCFDDLRKGGKYEVIFQLKEIEKSWQAGSDEKRLKNRRYEALKKLVETTDYFSEEEMQRRNPILYEQLIGKYHTDDERAAFLQQSWKSTSGSGRSCMPLTDLFLAHMERTSEGISCRRMEQECQQDEEDEADAEYDSDEDEGMDDSSPSTSKGNKNAKGKPSVNNEEGPREEIDEDEKELLKEEFFTTMYRNFLNGKDEDFDYSTVDDNPEYDCGENLENDQEEEYFDAEDPCEVSEPNSDLDDQFRPPVRSNEIESKIEKLSVTQDKTGEKAPDPERESRSEDTSIMDDEEDELDAYMREIEKQLK